MRTKERWKPINGYVGLYDISSLGRVRSLARIDQYSNQYGPCSRRRNERFLSVGVVRRYRRVFLYKNRSETRYNISRLVAKHFIPNPRRKPQVNHKDGVKTNDVVTNLEWVTPKENTLHARRVLGRCVGSNNGLSKLTESAIGPIRKARQAGMLLREIAKLWKVSWQAVGHVCSRRTWNHVA